MEAGYRDWLAGSNHPLDPSAKLNSNEKLHAKWTREHAALTASLNANNGQQEARAKSKKLQQQARDQEMLETYLQHENDAQRKAQAKRAKKRQMNRMEKKWVAQKIMANEVWVQQEAARKLAEEVANEKERLEKARAMQARYDAMWAANRTQLLDRTVHFIGRALPEKQCIRTQRDLPGEIEWRTLRQRSRPLTSTSEKEFFKSVPVLSRETMPALHTAPPLSRSRSTLGGGKHWAPAAWGTPVKPWSVALKATRSASAFSPPTASTTLSYPTAAADIAMPKVRIQQAGPRGFYHKVVGLFTGEEAE